MQMEFRPATADDLELMLAWRSHPKVYRHFYEQDEPLEWKEHLNWWESREHRRDWIITIREGDEWRDVGNLNISDLDSEAPEVGVYIGELTLWGKGTATEALNFAVDWLRRRGYSTARARILDDNGPSKGVFEKVGFQRIGDARENESEYEMHLG